MAQIHFVNFFKSLGVSISFNWYWGILFSSTVIVSLQCFRASIKTMVYWCLECRVLTGQYAARALTSRDFTMLNNEDYVHQEWSWHMLWRVVVRAVLSLSSELLSAGCCQRAAVRVTAVRVAVITVAGVWVSAVRATAVRVAAIAVAAVRVAAVRVATVTVAAVRVAAVRVAAVRVAVRLVSSHSQQQYYTICQYKPSIQLNTYQQDNSEITPMQSKTQ